MTKLIERTVQEKALEWLVNHYKNKARRKRIFAKMEVRTKKKHGGKRADGLLAYRRSFRSTYVVSMESKSYKTQKVITPRRDTKKWLGNSLFWGTMTALGSGVFFFINKIESPLWSLVYAVGLLAGVSFIIGWVTRNRASHKTMDVLKQIDQYPGNEQWLSTSKDSYDHIPVKLQSAFVKVLKARGVGLLLVDKRKRVTCVHKPKKRAYIGLKKDFLAYYSIEQDIRDFLKKR